MLPAPFRLSSTKSFAIVFKEGQYATSGALSIKWRSTHLPHSQVGFIASKKNFPKACDRNRAKRLLREAIRPSLFQLQDGFAIIILYRYKPDAMELGIITRDLRTLLEKNNLLRKIS